MTSPKNVAVKIYSLTGSLVADFYNNVAANTGLEINLSYLKKGGLDKFTINLANTANEPFYNDMECRFYVDGVHWDTGYATSIPEPDSYGAQVQITGNGYVHKFDDILVNETYTAQTLDFIVKDIASSYLGASLRVLYDVSLIATPTVSSIDIEFNDKKLSEVFDSLLDICNSNYATAQYRYFVDKDRKLNFALISQDTQEKLYEGYQFQSPEVSKVGDKIINKVLAYRTTSADDKATEYVATYSDADSITENGESAEKIVFPDYVSTATIQDMAESVISKYKDPLTRIEIKDLEVDALKPFGFYQIANRKLKFFRDVAEFESLTDWTSFLSSTVASVSSDYVLTGRTSLKLVASVGSQDEYLEKVFDPPVYFPVFFRVFSYRLSSSAEFIIRLFDTFGNTLDVPVGKNNEPTGEWLKYTVQINVVFGQAVLYVDRDVSNQEDMRVDVDGSTFGQLGLQYLIREGIINLSKIQIIMDHDVAATSYFDEFAVESTSHKEYRLCLEEAEYVLGANREVNLTLGDQVDSLIDELVKNSKANKAAIDIFCEAIGDKGWLLH